MSSKFTPEENVKWHSLSVEEVYAKLQTSIDGLSKPEAAARSLVCGKNVMTPGKSRTIWHMIWDQLYNIITVVLIAAAVIAGVFKEWVEVGFISAVVVLNTAIGVIQEGKAEAATKAIKNMVSAQCVAMRNGRKVTVDASDLVPGDIIHLTAGDRIPADVRWVSVSSMQVTEAMLTGESTPISKSVDPVDENAVIGDRQCMGFTGTLVFTGQGVAVVCTIGDNAEIGKINSLMANVDVIKTPLLVQIEQFGFGLSIICIMIAVIAFLVAYFANNLELHDSFTAAINIAVALIPEGLPTVVTITLALGVQAMARNKSIIRQLPAVETLGAVTVICSDKTGTLTKNEMTAVSLHTSAGVIRVTGTGYNPDGKLKYHDEDLDDAFASKIRQLLLPAVLCNDATLMPIVSAHAQHMLLTEPITLPSCLSGESAPPSPQLALRPDEGLNLPNVTIEAPTPAVGASILAAMTSSAREVAWNTTGDPTEAALLAVSMKAGLNLRTLNLLSQNAERLATIPFSSDYKFMATVHDLVSPLDGRLRRYLIVKGAPDVLLARCSTQAKDANFWESEPLQKEKWLATNASLSKEGLRVLALCVRELPIDHTNPTKEVVVNSSVVTAGEPCLQLNCLAAIVDPPREEAKRAVRSCHTAGVTVKMITGDHADTARTIGSWIGIETSEVLTGQQMELMTDEELSTHVNNCNIYARASPEHKLRIVRALQKFGHIVAMTGDGVNDAPALRQANIGVAMGVTGTEVAKEAARMILQDDNFATLEAAVLRGRATYDNLRKLILFLLPTTVAQGISLAVAVFMGVDQPLTAVQILYVNMITAATLGLVLAVEEPEPDVMTRPPRRQGKPLVGKLITWRTIFVATLIIVAVLGNQAWTTATNGSVRLGHTVAMNTLVFSQCLYCLSCRFISQSSVSINALVSNPLLTIMVLLNVALQCLITYTPGVQDVWETEGMNGYEWLRVLMFAFVIFFIVEAEKLIGPKIIRPYVMPYIKKLNAVLFSRSNKRNGAGVVITDKEIKESVLKTLEAHTPSLAAAGMSQAPSSLVLNVAPLPATSSDVTVEMK